MRYVELDLTDEQAELFKSFPEGRNQSISDECTVFYNGDYASNEINELVENLFFEADLSLSSDSIGDDILITSYYTQEDW